MDIEYSVILPAYNEEETIGRAIHETSRVLDSLGRPYEILVVDDGSSDETTSVAQRIADHDSNVRVIRHKKNRGKGAAVRTGVENARGEIMLFLDCDLSTHPQEFLGLRPLLKNNDVVIGSRRVKGARVAVPQAWHRSISGRLFNLAIRLYLKLPYHDTQCGFKAFRRETKPVFADLQTTGWAFDVELLVRARARGFRIAEYPVTWRNRAESRVKLSDAPKIFKDLRSIKKLAA